jgi:hypothetical protein
MRPTIRLAEWTLAVDLEATRAIQNSPGMPAYGCVCEDCSNWKQVHEEVIQPELRTQLERVGVSVSTPSDVYTYETNTAGRKVRVIFHAAGRLLQGPPAEIEHPSAGMMWNFVELSPPPRYVSMAIYPNRMTFRSAPTLVDRGNSEVLQVEFILFIPNGLGKRIDSGERDA